MVGILISAWLDVRSKPLRTVAAIAGMVAAVTAVVLVDAAGILSRQANGEYIARTWGRTATMEIFAPVAGGASLDAPPSAAGDVTSDAPDAASRLLMELMQNGVTRISTRVEMGMALVHGERAVSTRPSWVSSTYPAVSFVDLAAGSFPTRTAQSDVLHAVITLDLAEQLGFGGADAVGTVIGYALADGFIPDLRTAILRPLVVDAVARSLGTTSAANNVVVVSDLQRPDLIGRGGMSWLVHVNPADVGVVKERVAGFTASNTGEPLFIARRIDQGEDLAPVLNQQEVTAGAVTVVALIVGGLGVLGVGLASVRERGKDFGLRRALGASKSRVFAGVIVQTLLEVLLAAAIAIPFEAIAVELFARQLVLASLPLPSSTGLPLSSAARGLIAALVVGLIAGLLPAFRAARASVVQALRA